jgi:citrate synthase
MVPDWITAPEAANRLGIKQATLYAYVSRGMLARRREAGNRASLFDAAEVDRLARRGRSRRGTASGRFLMETGVTQIAGSALLYRGHDVIDLAARHGFEDVAALLWTGQLPVGQAGSWQAFPEGLAVGRAAQAVLPSATLPFERLQVIVPAMAATDRFRLHLDPSAVIVAGKSLIAGLTEALPRARPAAEPEVTETGAQAAGSIAAKLAAKLCLRSAPPGLARILDSALVLIADHELAGSTLAARVAASMRADPYAVVAAALGAMGGTLHGGAALSAEDMLATASSPDDVPRLVADVLRRGNRLPGFGNFVYENQDPRADALLKLLRGCAPGSSQLAVALAVIDETRGRGLPAPNVEFALAVLARVAGMARGSGEAIFAIGRTAGWLAHALEEYERNSPIRPRGLYTSRPGLASRGLTARQTSRTVSMPPPPG